MVVPIPHFTECRRNRCFFFLSHYFLSLSLSLSLSLPSSASRDGGIPYAQTRQSERDGTHPQTGPKYTSPSPPLHHAATAAHPSQGSSQMLSSGVFCVVLSGHGAIQHPLSSLCPVLFVPIEKEPQQPRVPELGLSGLDLQGPISPRVGSKGSGDGGVLGCVRLRFPFTA
jgi:hypothetical protein